MDYAPKGNSPLMAIRTKAMFLSKLVLSPRFYEVISEPLSNLSQLDTTLGTICYASLFLSAVVKQMPKLQLYLNLRKPKILKLLKLSAILILKQLLTSIKKLVNLFQAAAKQFHNFPRVDRVACTLDELVIMSLSKLDKANQQNMTNEAQMDEKVPEKHHNVDHISTTLRELSGYISGVRTFYRTFQIPQAIADLLSAPGQLWSEANYIDLISTISICLYQPFETVAFGLEKGWLLPPPKGPEKCGWWYIVSTRMWFLWVVVEFGHDTSHLITAVKNGLAVKGETQHSRLLLLTKALKNVDHAKWVTFIERFSTLPLCLHWSLEDGCLQPWQVGLFGTLAGGLSSALIWKNVWNKILKPE